MFVAFRFQSMNLIKEVKRRLCGFFLFVSDFNVKYSIGAKKSETKEQLLTRN